METLKTSFILQSYCYYGSNAARIDFYSFRDEECIQFIQNYFTAGGKEEAILEVSQAFNEFPSRASHSVSAYMIGLLAYQTYQDRINAQLVRVSVKEFSYIWFLICLYHDYGYFYERNPEFIDCSLYKEILSNIRQINSSFWDGRYDYELVKAYFKFRMKREHGIIAGALLRKRLNKNLNYAISQNPGQDPNDFTWRNLHWSQKHREWYDFAASLIIKHNIWFANNEVDNSDQDDVCKNSNRQSLANYNVNPQLKRLIISNSQRMVFDENPLLFILCMIDTIEPVKIGHRINKKERIEVTNAEIIDMVNIRFKENAITIQIEKKDRYNELLHHEIYNNAKRLETWMDVRVSKIEQPNSFYQSTMVQW